MKLNPESTMTAHSGVLSPSAVKRDPYEIMAAAGRKRSMSVAPSIQGGAQLTCASMIRLEFVFFEHKLVVNILDIGEVEVRFGDDERRLWRVHLRGL